MKNFEELTFNLCEQGIFCFESSPKAKKIAVVKKCILFIVYKSIFLSLAWYFVFEAQTSSEYSESMVFALGALLIIWWYSVLIFQSEKYIAIMDELNSIIEKRIIDPSVNLIYERTNFNTARLTKIIFSFFRTCGMLYIIAPAFLSLFNYITSGFSNESFQQSFPASYPFDWKTPFGYAACVSIQFLSAMSAQQLYAGVLVLTIAMCMLISSFASDIQEKLHQFNRILVSTKDKKLTAKEQILLKKKLYEIIQFHSDARDFANRFSDLNEAIVFGCPIFTIAVFGGLISQIILLTTTGDIVGITQIAILVVACMFPFFLFCHFGGKMTQQFEDIGNAVYQLKWYRLPLDMQKDLQIMIALAQKRIYIRGYADTCTTHSVFTTILKNKFFYFMFVRRL